MPTFSSSYSSIWLNEGFATYVESNIGTAHVLPDNGYLERFVLTIHSVMQDDSLTSSHPMSVPVEHPEDVFQIFDSISYSKGASVIRMMAHFLQNETFKKGITSYLKAYMYGNARQDDLWEKLTEAAREDATLPPDLTVKDIMDTWTLQMGYPVLNVNREFTNNTGRVEVSQERFLLIQNDESRNQPAYKWWVPITFTTTKQSDFEKTATYLWLSPNKSKESFAIEDAENPENALIFNIQQTGFYRVNYNLENWKLIGEQLRTNHSSIHIMNRAQILDDAMNLARSNLLDYETALKQTEYLKYEKEYVPWSSAIIAFNYLDSMLGRDQIYGEFAAYFIEQLTPIYTDLGFYPTKDDTFTEGLLRTSVVSYMCKLHQEECVQNSINQFDDWMTSNINPIDSSERYSVYCTAIYFGEENEWNFLWEQMIKTENAEEKDNIIRALGCSSQIWQLQV